jgi:hypothetical protein
VGLQPRDDAPVSDPETVVQAQLDAFNEHDLDALLPLFAEDVVIHDLVDGSVMLRGIEAFRDRYVAVFRDRPRVRADLIGRLGLGSFVIDRERLTDGDEHPPEDALAIYEVDGRVITRMWFIEPEHRRRNRPGSG